MLDDLRNTTKEKNKIPEPQEDISGGEPEKKRFLGMTSSQRLLVAVFLLIITLILGCSCLWIFGKIQIPFM